MFLFNFWDLLREKARGAQNRLSIEKHSSNHSERSISNSNSLDAERRIERIRSPTRSIQPREVYLFQVENLHRIGRSRFNYSIRTLGESRANLTL